MPTLADIYSYIDTQKRKAAGAIRSPMNTLAEMAALAGDEARQINRETVLSSQGRRQEIANKPMSPEQEAAREALLNRATEATLGVFGTTFGAGLQKMRSEAKNLSEKQFLDKYVTQTMPEHLQAKKLPEGVANQKPHDFLPPGLLDPSEWDSWSDRWMAGTPEKIKNFRAAMRKGDVFPPVLVRTRKGEFPIVEDGHHRVAAYMDEGAKSVPVSLDIESLIKIWKEENKSTKKLSDIYQEYKKTLAQ